MSEFELKQGWMKVREALDAILEGREEDAWNILTWQPSGKPDGACLHEIFDKSGACGRLTRSLSEHLNNVAAAEQQDAVPEPAGVWDLTKADVEGMRERFASLAGERAGLPLGEDGLQRKLRPAMSTGGTGHFIEISYIWADEALRLDFVGDKRTKQWKLIRSFGERIAAPCTEQHPPTLEGPPEEHTQAECMEPSMEERMGEPLPPNGGDGTVVQPKTQDGTAPHYLQPEDKFRTWCLMAQKSQRRQGAQKEYVACEVCREPVAPTHHLVAEADGFYAKKKGSSRKAHLSCWTPLHDRFTAEAMEAIEGRR